MRAKIWTAENELPEMDLRTELESYQNDHYH
jgi:hypothetical protein